MLNYTSLHFSSCTNLHDDFVHV